MSTLHWPWVEKRIRLSGKAITHRTVATHLWRSPGAKPLAQAVRQKPLDGILRPRLPFQSSLISSL